MFRAMPAKHGIVSLLEEIGAEAADAPPAITRRN
jgi:hypothetical protein